MPTSALRFDQNAPYVVVVQQGVAVERPVTLGQRGEAAFGAGLRAEAAVEVTAGLEPGAIVLRGTVGNLRAGTRLALPPGTPAVPAAAAAAATAAAANAATTAKTASPAPTLAASR